MSKNAIVGGLIAIAVVCILAGSVATYSWDVGDEAQKVPFGLEDDGTLSQESINYNLYEIWGPVLLVLGTLMFGAIIAGVCISKEDEDKKEEDE